MTSSKYSNVIASICNKITGGSTITAAWLDDNGSCMLDNRYSVTYNPMQKEAFFCDGLTDTTVLCRGMSEHGFVAVVEVAQRDENAFYCTSVSAEMSITTIATYDGVTTEICGLPVKSYRIMPFGMHTFMMPSEK